MNCHVRRIVQVRMLQKALMQKITSNVVSGSRLLFLLSLGNALLRNEAGSEADRKVGGAVGVFDSALSSALSFVMVLVGYTHYIPDMPITNFKDIRDLRLDEFGHTSPAVRGKTGSEFGEGGCTCNK